MCWVLLFILGTDDSRGKSVIERALVVGKKAGNGFSVRNK